MDFPSHIKRRKNDDRFQGCRTGLYVYCTCSCAVNSLHNKRDYTWSTRTVVQWIRLTTTRAVWYHESLIVSSYHSWFRSSLGVPIPTLVGLSNLVNRVHTEFLIMINLIITCKRVNLNLRNSPPTTGCLQTRCFPGFCGSQSKELVVFITTKKFSVVQSNRLYSLKNLTSSSLLSLLSVPLLVKVKGWPVQSDLRYRSSITTWHSFRHSLLLLSLLVFDDFVMLTGCELGPQQGLPCWCPCSPPKRRKFLPRTGRDIRHD